MPSTHSDNEDRSASDAWRDSRSGARASRGFHYQHLVSALILVRQWAGLAPAGHLVPEGIEDCVVESHDHVTWIQAKSRSSRTFGEAEIRRILDAVDAKAAQFPDASDIQTAAVLEKPATGVPTKAVEHLFDGSASSVIHCPDPATDILNIFSEHLDVAPVVAEGLRSDLYELVAEASAANATASFDNRVRLSTTEVERHILERLEADDPSAIDEAMTSGALTPVDFATPINEPAFYQGVKVRPSHVVAGLVLARNADVANVISSLQRRRHVLLTGPSGAGKSALTWLSAHALAERMRCFEVTAIADVGWRARRSPLRPLPQALRVFAHRARV